MNSRPSMIHPPTSIAAAVVALVAPGVGLVAEGGDGLDLLQDGVQFTIGPSCNKEREREMASVRGECSNAKTVLSD